MILYDLHILSVITYDMQMIYYRMKEESQQTWEDEGERGTYQLSWTLFFVVQDNVGTVRQFFFRYRYSTRI